MAQSKVDILRNRLADHRSHRIVAVSHCLLNENARYLGGAFRKGPVNEVVDHLQREGIGIYQMPCPEQWAWGGVLRPYMLAVYGSKGSLLYRLRRPLAWLVMAKSRVVYRRMARRVASDLADYTRSGTAVLGIVGISASPTCGVLLTTDIGRSVEVLAACKLDTLSPKQVNENVFSVATKSGQGLYIRTLRKRLDKKGLDIPFVEHDFLAEMRGEPIAPLLLCAVKGGSWL